MKKLLTKQVSTELLDKKNAGYDLLSHVLLRSTIGAEGLDFRVRDGNGYFSFAIVTGKNS